MKIVEAPIEARSATLLGAESHPVTICVTPGDVDDRIEIRGLTDAAAREARVRVASALSVTGHRLERGALVEVDGCVGSPAALDLAVALAVVASQDGLPAEVLEKWRVVGELGLNGSVRPVRGALAHCEVDLRPVLCPDANRAEAALALTTARRCGGGPVLAVPAA